MKSLLWTVLLSAAIYWIAKPITRNQLEREVAQADTANAQTRPSLSDGRLRPEEAARKTADAYRQRGIPRKASEEFNVLDVMAVGTQIVLTYELSSPAVIPITNQLIAEMRQETVRNFASSEFCSNSVFRSMLRDGVSIVHHYRLFRSPRTILSVQLGIKDC